ncbi:hypothetical protein [Kitasatospora sp. NPDC088346]|uniref:hypothetical protein n=1 Tax=Kitasatospora sp. NPDC088346 TaxID=3364073 RepID=UPI0037F27EA3
MTDHDTASLVAMIIAAVTVLTPLAGAVVAAVFIRRRGLNARLATAGCLVMAPGPLMFTLGTAFGLDGFLRDLGPYMAVNALSALSMSFHLVGLGLVVAGALVPPRPPAGIPLAPLPDAATGYAGWPATDDGTAS